MTPIAYTVIAGFPDEPTRGEFLAWLRGGHVDEVIQGGAESASIVTLDREAPDGPLMVEVRYIFALRETLEHYICDAAPALRAAGLARFPPERGVTFRRTIGEIDTPALRGRLG